LALALNDAGERMTGECTMVKSLGWRCVVTAHQADGRPIFESDESLRELDSSAATHLGRILTLVAPPKTADDGSVNEAGNESGPGSLTVDAIVVGPKGDEVVDTYPGSTQVFEAYVVVQGSLHVSVGSDEAVLHQGQVFIPRGQPYGMTTSKSEGTRLVRVRSVADPSSAIALPAPVRSLSGSAHLVRRVVGGTNAAGQPGIVQDGDPAVMFVLGEESDPDVPLADVWEFGGPLRSVEQGGDAPEPYTLEPRSSGMKILNLEMRPAKVTGPPNEGGCHATATIDVDIVIDGTVEMFLPDLPPVTLRPGDLLVQRGTSHLWRVIGDHSLRMVTMMVGVHDRLSPATSS
jgi:hypothetical protein